MTKHGVVIVPEDAVLAGGQHFSFPPPRTGDSCKKLAGQVDLGGAMMGSWIDSMKASSPRHKLMAPAVIAAGDAEHDEWMEKHPSALGRFEAVEAAAKGKRIVMFLDYDGTLSPIVEDPDRAVMTDEMRDTVRGVAEHFPTAIVSGRCRDKVFNFVRLAELYYAGSHGMDIKGPTADSDKVYDALTAKMEPIPGAKVENNKFCLSVHFRCVDEKVLEIRPMIKWDKGNALEFLLESLGYGECSDVFPIYIGDDSTDEDAFKVLRSRAQGAGILVSKFPKETNASFSLREPSEVKEFLRKLVKSKS